VSENTGHADPLVSVVVPTRDRCDAMRKCLDALAAQTHADFEVIVVDDASHDGTPGMLIEFEREHPKLRMRRVINASALGANRSRNRGISAARGRFVAFLDSDCVPRPDWLDKLLVGFSDDRVAAVSGLVEDPPPSNVYELAFRGTHRLRPGRAGRLVGGNMCIRRHLLMQRPLDEDLVWGCDEEGLFLWLNAEGWEQRVVTDAVVLHEHHYTRKSFFRQALLGGEATARLVYKYHLPARLDLALFVAAYLTLPYAIIHPWLAVVPAMFFAAAMAAIAYNDLVRKGKTITETIRSFPVLLLYYQVRLVGYACQSATLLLRRSAITRERLTGPRPAPGGERAA
jgi:glycosyltransferase involved in cell wall biosynthesis